MKVTVKDIRTPRMYRWADISNREAAQSAANPCLVVLKITQNQGMRLTHDVDSAKLGNAVNPGAESLWYICQCEVIITPAVRGDDHAKH